MPRYRITFNDKSGKPLYLSLTAADKEEAHRLALVAQERRHARFPLTFHRLELAADTGKTGQLAVDPRTDFTQAWVKAEVEKRKRDQGRYDDGTLKLVRIEERIG